MNDGVMHAPVLVTGANSQVGLCALDRLAESNVSVVAFVRHMHPEIQDLTENFIAVSYTHLTLPTICSV